MSIDLNAKNQFILTMEMRITAAIAAGSLVIFIGVFIWFVSPVQRKVEELSKRHLTISRVNVSELNKLTTERDRLLLEKEHLTKIVVQNEETLSGAKNISHVIDKFVEIAKKRRLEFTYLKPHPLQMHSIGGSTPQEPAIELKEMPVSLGLSADFTDFLQFLWDTEHIDKTLKITKMTIERNETMRHNERLELRILQLSNKNKDTGKP